jgi:hypothetical protein
VSDSSLRSAVQLQSTGALAENLIVRVSADGIVDLASAAGAPTLRGLLGVTLNAVGGVGPVQVTVAGQATILLEVGLTPLAGDTIYVSSTSPGRGTNVPPMSAVVVATVEDASRYAIDGTVLVNVAAQAASGGGGAAAEFIQETVTNEEGDSLLIGEVVRISTSNGAVLRSQADTLANVSGTVGVTTAVIASGASGVIANAGLVDVLMDSTLVSASAGDRVWVSAAEAGRATNGQPGLNDFPLGTIKNAIGFPLVKIDLIPEQTPTAYVDVIAIGNEADASGSNQGIAIGANATVRVANDDEAHIAIGLNAEVGVGLGPGDAPSGIAVGRNTKSAPGGIAIGRNADCAFATNDTGGIAIGDSANADSAGGANIAIGQLADADGANSVAIGFSTSAQAGAVVITSLNTTVSPGAVVIKGTGQNAPDSVAIKGTALAGRAVAIGDACSTETASSVVIGADATASGVGTGGIAIGSGAVSENGGICIGVNSTEGPARAITDGSIAIGRSSSAEATESLAIGSNADVSPGATAGIAIGRDADVTAPGVGSIALGDTARAIHSNAIVIGRSAISTAANQCRIGSTSSGMTELHVVGPFAGTDPLHAYSVGFAAPFTGLLVAADVGAGIVKLNVRSAVVPPPGSFILYFDPAGP